MPRPMDMYPDSWGSHRAAVVGHQGPSTYTVVTEQSAPTQATGGDSLTAVECGMKYLEFVNGGLSDSGTYRVECFPRTPSGLAANAAYQPLPYTEYGLRWVVVATGAEAGAVDLSAEYVRLLAVGAK
jgi:hypothetical protein